MGLNALPQGPLGLRMDQMSTADQLAAIGLVGTTTLGVWKGIGAWIKRRAENKEQREARLRSWEDSLQRREKDYREDVEERLEKVIKRTLEQDGLIAAQSLKITNQNKLLFVTGRTLVAVTVELRELNPDSILAARAQRFLDKHFKPDFDLDGWEELLNRLDENEEE